MFFTNRGKYLIMRQVFNGTAMVTANFYVALCAATTTPTVDTNTFGQLTEIATGNGYTSGGVARSPNATDFPSLTQDSVNDLASVVLADTSWTASGGPIPATGGARWLVLLTDEATVADRQVVAYIDLGSDQSATSGQTLTFTGATLRATQPA